MVNFQNDVSFGLSQTILRHMLNTLVSLSVLVPHIQRFNTYFTDLPPKTTPPQKQNYMQLNNE